MWRKAWTSAWSLLSRVRKVLFTAVHEGGSPSAVRRPRLGPVTLRRQVALVMPLSGEELSVSLLHGVASYLV